MDAPTLIKPLTSLRFVAALMVLSQHYFGFEAGYSGVSFFYVLSGFILTVNYGDLVDDREGRLGFWWKRFARIYPTYLLTLLLAIPVRPWSTPVFLSHLAMIQSFIPSWEYWFGFNSPSWSLSNEAAFYAVFPWLLVWLKRRPVMRIGLWTLAMLAFATAWAIAFPELTMNSGIVRFLFYIAPPLRFFEFGLGVAIGLTARGSVGLRGEVIALAIAIASVLSLYLDPPGAFAGALIFVPGAVAVVYVFSRGSGPVSQFLSHRWLVLLGNASFSLYMIHLLLYFYAEQTIGWTFPIACMTAVAAVASSVLLYLWFERPAQRLLLRLGESRQRRLSEQQS